MKDDELCQLWNLDPGSGGRDTRELMHELERAASRFDRTIRLRDLREIAGGLLAAAAFLWLAIHDRTPLERAAHLWLAASGVWIAFYIRRYSKISERRGAEQTLLRHREELLDRYDRQIRLLRSARYWCILPFWVGLLFSAAAALVRTGDLLRFGLEAGFATVLSAAVWWLNEGIGVAHLQERRRQVE